MKKLAAVIALICACYFPGSAQVQEADTLPYLKYPVLPTFEILMEDSSTKFSTYYIPDGRPVILMYFSPDCGHCFDIAQQLLARKDDLGKTRIYMVTPMSLAGIKDFSEKLNLKKHKNITIGKDYQFFCINFYGIKTFPFVAVYDVNKKLIQAFPGKLTVEDVIKAVDRAR